MPGSYHLLWLFIFSYLNTNCLDFLVLCKLNCVHLLAMSFIKISTPSLSATSIAISTIFKILTVPYSTFVILKTPKFFSKVNPPPKNENKKPQTKQTTTTITTTGKKIGNEQYYGRKIVQFMFQKPLWFWQCVCFMYFIFLFIMKFLLFPLRHLYLSL